MVRRTIGAVVAMCALALAGCNDKAADKGGADTTQAASGRSGWNAADACSILDKAAVAETLSQDVTETRLNFVNEAGDATAATSECTYIGKDGASSARLMTRWSPIDDNTQASIDGARAAVASATEAFSSKPIEDVAGLGKAAFFVPGINQLNVFIDDARMIVVTPEKLPDGATGKDLAVALARKAGA